MTVTDADSPPRRRARILILAGAALLLFIGVLRREDLAAALARLAPGQAALALLVLLSANLVFARYFALVGQDHRVPGLPVRQWMGIFLVSQSAKYVPGKIWSVVMQAGFARGRVGAGRLIWTNVETALAALGATTALGLALLVARAASVPWLAPVLVALAVPVCTRAARMRPVRTRIARLAGAAAHAPAQAVPPAHAVRADLLLAAFVALYAVGWLLFAGPAFGLPVGSALHWLALLGLSYVAGVASMVPAGLGTRELSLLGLAAASGLDSQLAAGIAVASRFMMFGIDALSLPLGAALLRTPVDRLESR